MEITYTTAFGLLDCLEFPEYTFGPVVEQTEPIKETAQVTGSFAGATPTIIGSFGGTQTIQ